MNKKLFYAERIGICIIVIFIILFYLFLALAFIGIIPFNKNENKAFTSITYSCKTKKGEYFGDDIENIPDNFIIKKNHPYDIFLDGDKCNIIIYCEKSQ